MNDNAVSHVPPRPLHDRLGLGGPLVNRGPLRHKRGVRDRSIGPFHIHRRRVDEAIRGVDIVACRDPDVQPLAVISAETGVRKHIRCNVPIRRPLVRVYRPAPAPGAHVVQPIALHGGALLGPESVDSPTVPFGE